MNELNEAYDMLMNPDKYAHRQQQSSPYGSSSSYGGNPYGQRTQQSGPYSQQGNPYGQRQGGYGGWQTFGGFGFEELFGFGPFQAQVPPPQEQPGDSQLVRQAIRDILQRQYASAITHLQNVVSTQRNARWYYLSGVANHGAGNLIQAVEHMTRACQMEPNSQAYRALLNQYRQAGQTYAANSQGYGPSFCSSNYLCYLCCMAQLCCPYRLPIFCC